MKNHKTKWLTMYLCILLPFGFSTQTASAETYITPQASPNQQHARDMLDSEYFYLQTHEQPFSSTALSPLTIVRQGRKIPYTTVLNNPTWERPVYRTYWSQSVAGSGGRWSDPTGRVHYALHRIFASYVSASIYYDFVHNVGIDAEMINVPVQGKRVFDNVVFVVMQANVKSVYAKGNQIVIVATPQRTGLHVFTLKTADVPSLHPKTKKEPNLIQLVTPDGHEIDYWVF